jgi:hypothetical protein
LRTRWNDDGRTLAADDALASAADGFVVLFFLYLFDFDEAHKCDVLASCGCDNNFTKDKNVKE